MKKGLLTHLLSGKEAALNGFLLVLILACLYWRSQDHYGDGYYGVMAVIFTLLLLFSCVYSYYKYKP